MRTRIAAVAAAVLALIIGVGVVNVAAPASALSPGVAFAAEDQPSWQTNGTVYALGAAGTKVVAGGTFSQIRPPAGSSEAAQSRSALVVLDAETGQPDACQFAVALSGGTPTVRAIAVSSDQSKVYIGGNFSMVGGVNVARIAVLDVQACTVAPFRAPLPGSTVTALALHGDVLYAGGLFKTVGGQTREAFAAFNATSGALLPWTANAVRGRTDLPKEVNEARAIAVSPDGAKVVVGGDLFSINGQSSHSIAIVSGASITDGTGGEVLRTYSPGFIPDTSVTKTIIDGGDGRFYIGNEGTGGGVFDGRASFSWATGDQVWRDTCLGATQALVMHQGTLYSASHAHDCSGINAFNDGVRRYFMAQNPDSMEVLGWLPLGNDGIGEGIGPRALIVATGRLTGQRYLYSGGDFTTINGHAQQGITRFGPQDTGAPPTPVVSAQATSDGTVQVRFRTVVDADDSHLTYSVYRGNATEPVWSGTGKSLWWERPQVTFVDTDVTPGATYTYRVTASDGTNTSARSAAVSATARAAGADYAAAVRADAPNSLWSGSTNGTWVHDSAAAQTRTDAVPATLMDGATTSSAGAVPGGGGSLQFDGVNDYAITDQLRPGPTTYSVEAWINTTTTSGGKIAGFGNGRPRTGSNVSNLSGSYDRHVYMQNDGRVTFGVYTGGTSTITSPQALNDGQWHQIVATQGPTGMTLYVDGLRVASNANPNQQGYWGVWRVGGDQLGGWPNSPSSNFFGGLIDEVAIYPSALPAKRVAAHYLASGRELDVNAAPADAYGAAVFAGDPSLYWRFDDTDGTARDASLFGTEAGTYNTGAVRQPSGAVSGSGSVTLPGDESGTVGLTRSTVPSSTTTGEIWFRTDTTAGGKLFGFENTLTGNGNNYDKHLYMTNDGHLVWGSWIGSSAVVTSPASYNDNVWHQAVGIIDDSGRKLYVDGQLVASSNVTGAEMGEGRWRVGGGNIGGWPGQPSSFYFDGELDEFAIYPTSLDAATIARHYAIGIADTTAPTAPTALTAAAQADGVHLAWGAATDDHAVTSYTVYRGATADFVPGEETRLGTSATTTFVDDARVPGTHYYRVVAVDAAGNVGPATDAVEVVLPDTTAPQTPAAPTVTVGADGGRARLGCGRRRRRGDGLHRPPRRHGRLRGDPRERRRTGQDPRLHRRAARAGHVLLPARRDRRRRQRQRPVAERDGDGRGARHDGAERCRPGHGDARRRHRAAAVDRGDRRPRRDGIRGAPGLRRRVRPRRLEPRRAGHGSALRRRGSGSRRLPLQGLGGRRRRQRRRADLGGGDDRVGRARDRHGSGRRRRDGRAGGARDELRRQHADLGPRGIEPHRVAAVGPAPGGPAGDRAHPRHPDGADLDRRHGGESRRHRRRAHPGRVERVDRHVEHASHDGGHPARTPHAGSGHQHGLHDRSVRGGAPFVARADREPEDDGHRSRQPAAVVVRGAQPDVPSRPRARVHSAVRARYRGADRAHRRPGDGLGVDGRARMDRCDRRPRCRPLRHPPQHDAGVHGLVEHEGGGVRSAGLLRRSGAAGLLRVPRGRGRRGRQRRPRLGRGRRHDLGARHERPVRAVGSDGDGVGDDRPALVEREHRRRRGDRLRRLPGHDGGLHRRRGIPHRLGGDAVAHRCLARPGNVLVPHRRPRRGR
ncbi:MAG: LamG domain-containing protein [Microbacterium arborescens]